MNAKDLQPTGPLKILFVGRSGSWKSSCAASFPGPTYCFDLDHRIQALRGKDVEYDSFYAAAEGFWKMDDKLSLMLTQAKNRQFPYKTVLFSSLTSLQDFAILEATRWMLTTDDSEGRYGQRIGDPKNPKRQKILPGLRHFNYAFTTIRDVLENALLAFPCNVIVEAHEVSTYDFDAKQWRGKKLSVIPSATEYIPTKFDEVWNFFVDEGAIVGKSKVRHYVRFNGELAKTTFRQLPDVLEITESQNFYNQVQEIIK